eukprot:scaffold11903_cov297-Chaetoceros_neogracile.AAC.1
MDDGRRRLKAKKKFNEQQLSQRGHYADVFYFFWHRRATGDDENLRGIVLHTQETWTRLQESFILHTSATIATMLRAAATKLRRVQGTPTTRSITSAQKRAIKKEQITPSSASSDTTTKFAKPPTATVPPPPSSSSSASSGGSLAPAILGFTALGVGGAYYMDMIPSSLERIPVLGSLISSPKDESEEKVVPVTDIPADKKEEEAKEETTVTATETEPVKDEEKKEEPEEEPTSDTAPTSMVQEGGNRVLNITAPDNKGRKSEPMPEKGH